MGGRRIVKQLGLLGRSKLPFAILPLYLKNCPNQTPVGATLVVAHPRRNLHSIFNSITMQSSPGPNSTSTPSLFLQSLIKLRVASAKFFLQFLRLTHGSKGLFDSRVQYRNSDLDLHVGKCLLAKFV